MKLLNLFLCLFGLVFNTLAQNTSLNEIIVPTKITKASLCANGAKITREGQVTCPIGKTTLVFDNLPNSIHMNDILIECGTPIDIVSSSLRINQKSRGKDGVNLYGAQSLIKEYKFYRSSSTDLIQILEKEYQERDKIDSLKETSSLYLDSLKRIKANILYQNLRIKEYNYKIKQLQNQVKHLKEKSKAQKQYILTFNNTHKEAISFKIYYKENRVKWEPEYTIHIKTDEQSFQVDYNLNIHQYTGENWDDVYLYFSKGNMLQINNTHTKTYVKKENEVTKTDTYGTLKGVFPADEREEDYFFEQNYIYVYLIKEDTIIKEYFVEEEFELDSIPVGEYSIELKNKHFQRKHFQTVSIKPSKTTEIDSYFYTEQYQLITGGYELANGVIHKFPFYQYPYIDYPSHCDWGKIFIYRASEEELKYLNKRIIDSAIKYLYITPYNKFLTDHYFTYPVSLKSKQPTVFPFTSSNFFGEIQQKTTSNLKEKKQICVLTDWKSKDFIPGQAKIYFDDTYMGSKYLDNTSPSDTLDLGYYDGE